ncbi:MAG TPA: glycerophosphodiester phosphodiesterase [Acidimicrobiales bacterium]|nr:glycerophosphodiester phosphodiesterase [Acidimicrobiales bacterium]
MDHAAPDRPVIGFAHRGARAHAPENTIEAFLTACRMGATALETDVWLTRDGIPVLDHDGRVGRFGRSRPIAEVHASELPGHIPSLSELQASLGTHIRLSIDVKDPRAIEAIIAVRATAGVEALRHTWLCDPDVDRLARWRRLDPDVRLVASERRRHLRRLSLAALAGRGIEVVNLPHRSWTPRLVDDCHRAGLLAFAWGVQCPARMHRLIGWGIDALYSDHTDRMVAALHTTRTRPVGFTTNPGDPTAR